MDEADVRQKARVFVAKVDVSNIREDLSPYVTGANAKVKKDELAEGESGYTVTKPNGNRFGARVEDDGGLAELTGELPWQGQSRRR